ncbi:MAG: WYL domain-containing transcriptional regulator [Clostridia bacterium]|nr:MAG: WYL domain-containing transcriptional regulator [Clostridia bacterium]
MRYDRLLRLVRLADAIARHPGQSYAYFARGLGVHERTIRRDVDALGEAGMPVETSSGIRFMNHGALPPVFLDYSQATALYIAATALANHEALRRPLEEALQRIAGVIPEELQEACQEVAREVRLFPAMPPDSPRAQEMLVRLRPAVEEHRRVRIKYFSFSSQATSWRTVDPYALFFRRRAWYLAGLDHKNNKILLFRLARIEAMEHTVEYFDLPEDFDLEEFLGQGFELMPGGEPVTIVARFRPEVSQLILEATFHRHEEKVQDQDGSVLYRLKVNGWKEVFFWLLSYGASVEILEPDWLRREALTVAQAMVQMYVEAGAGEGGAESAGK